jgi:hypothetical protein
LRNSGSAQQDGPSGAAGDHPIGSRPDLAALVGLLAPGKDEAKEAKEAKNEVKENNDAKAAKDDPDKAAKDGPDGKQTKDSGDQKFEKDFRDKGSGKHENDHLPNVIPLGPSARRTTEPVRHFITGELRPELSASALLHEPDLRGRDAAELADELRPCG